MDWFDGTSFLIGFGVGAFVVLLILRRLNPTYEENAGDPSMREMLDSIKRIIDEDEQQKPKK